MQSMQTINELGNADNAAAILSAVDGARNAMRRGDLDGAVKSFRSAAAEKSPATLYLAHSRRSARELCAELLREAAFCEIINAGRNAFSGFNFDKLTLSDGALAQMMNELKTALEAEIRKAPDAAENLFYLEGLAGILASDRNGAIKSFKCAGLLFSAASKGERSPLLYDAILAALYFTGPDAARLVSISDDDGSGAEKLAVDKPHVAFIYEILLAGLAATTDGKPENKKKARTEITRYPNGKLKSEIRYSGAERDGVSKRYDAAGKLVERSQWRNGHPVHCVYYDGTGLPLEGKNTVTAETYGGAVETLEGKFINGQPDGTIKCYLTPENGKKILFCEKNFKKGRPDGEFRYFSDGDPSSVTTRRIYRNGEITETIEYEKRGGERETRMYFKNGTVIRVETRRKGELVYERDYGGPNEVTYEKVYSSDNDGPLYLSELKSYLGNEAHGIFYQYGPNGKTLSATPYKNGVISGLFKKYHANGNIALIQSCHDDDYENLSAGFDENARLVSLRLFEIEWAAR